MSSRNTGSRYPSAFGHTPTYRSYSSIPDASISGISRDLTRDLGISNAGEIRIVYIKCKQSFTTFFPDYFHFHCSVRGSSSNAASKKVSSYSSSYSSTSKDGGRPVTEYSTDSTYKSTATGSSGIPHTSYSHTSSGFSSENPYKNRVSSFSYNI
eukprot:02758.XXX_18716_18141_1 [CDS] Oithona nana genome sequencing.